MTFYRSAILGAAALALSAPRVSSLMRFVDTPVDATKSRMKPRWKKLKRLQHHKRRRKRTTKG